jgi:uncharacterized membrane protein YphA (DoxX/SURF4 family)
MGGGLSMGSHQSIKMKLKISKAKLWDYFILTARFLLAWTFLGYGYGKLTAGQFGISEAELATPLQDLSLFRVSWYLFDHEPFKSFIGVSQVLCGLLLLVNRTVLIGVFFFLPIAATILITIVRGDFSIFKNLTISTL